MSESDKQITVGDFRKHLDSYPDDHILTFNGLAFAQLKRRDDDQVNVEFNEIIIVNDDGKAFIVETTDG